MLNTIHLAQGKCEDSVMKDRHQMLFMIEIDIHVFHTFTLRGPQRTDLAATGHLLDIGKNKLWARTSCEVRESFLRSPV